MNVRPGPSYRLAADLARAGDHPTLCIIATAVGDDSARLAAAHNAFCQGRIHQLAPAAVPDAERTPTCAPTCCPRT